MTIESDLADAKDLCGRQKTGMSYNRAIADAGTAFSRSSGCKFRLRRGKAGGSDTHPR